MTGVPPRRGFDWEAAGRALGESLDEYCAVVVIGVDPVATGRVAVALARVQAARRRVAVGDLFAESPPIQELVHTEDPHGLVDSFLYGCSPALYGWIAEEVSAVLVGQADVIVDGFPTNQKAKKNEYKEKVRSAVKDVAVELLRGIGKRRVERYYDPIVGSIEHLPKNELALVASTLVSLSSFQKRV